MFEFKITNKNYHSLDYYLKSKYNKKVFKISLNASFTCPNRDGSKGTGGCAFCSEQGSGDFAGNVNYSLKEQFNQIKSIMEKKWKDAYYIVYFQSFSNTYASVERLKEVFEQFIGVENVIGLSIATRCDCINKEIVDYLATLKKHFKEFWIELGLQSTKRSTMKLMNLKYNFSDFKNAVNLLNKEKIDVITHIIDGLPFESMQDQIKTILKINKLPIKGLKVHVLNVIKNTKIAKMYLNKEFEVIDDEAFIDIVTSQLYNLRSDIIIHRIGADSGQDDLIAPLWVRKKLAIVDKIDIKMKNDNLFQGDLII